MTAVEPFNHVEFLRARCIRAVDGVRQYASMLPGGGAVADLLRGDEGRIRQARIVEFMLAELGFETDVKADDTRARSRTRRAIARQGG